TRSPHPNLTHLNPYCYRLCSSDKGRNTRSPRACSADPCAPDPTAPAGSLTINAGGAYTASTSVTLALAATDTVGVTGYYLATSRSEERRVGTECTSRAAPYHYKRRPNSAPSAALAANPIHTR